MECVLYFAQKPIPNESLVRGIITDVDIGMPNAHMKVIEDSSIYKLCMPWQMRTPHLVECIQEGKCFKIECCAYNHEIISLSLMVDPEQFLEEIKTSGTFLGEVHMISIVMDIWREARVPFVYERFEPSEALEFCHSWNTDYPLFGHQIDSLQWMANLEKSSDRLEYYGNIKIPGTNWFVDTENECLTTDPSIREGNIRGGILASATGTGKTATMLYHILSDKKDNSSQVINNYVSNATLIIVPVNLISQWISEIEKFTKTDKISIVRFYQSKHIKTISMKDLLNANIVITTLHFLRTSKPYSDIIESALTKVNISGKECRTKSAFSSWARLRDNTEPILESIFWKRVVVDEIHTVFENQREIRQVKQFMSKFCWGITATPDVYTENSQQLYWLLKREKAHHPNMLQSLIKTCIHKTNNNMEWPSTSLNLINLTAKERLYLQAQESELTPTEIIKLISFVNVSDDKCSCTSENLEKEIKEQKEKYVETIQAKLNEYDTGIQILEKASVELDKQITIISEKIEDSPNDELLKTQLEVAKTSSERHIQELKQIREMRNITFSKLERSKRSIEFVNDRLNLLKNRNQECPICLENKCSIILPCGHLFCSQCIRKSHKIKNVCPECRQEFSENMIRGVTLGGIGTKMLEIAKLIESINDPIVLFVQWKCMLRGMKSFLRGMNIKVLTLEGSVTQRSNTLIEFTLGGVLLLCLEDSFAGLHLSHAHHVIFSHAIVGDVRNVKMLEQQAIARCVRQGQTERVKVYSFVVKDCDEEIIWNNTHVTG